MRKLSGFGKRILGNPARKLSSVVGMVANDLRGGLRELLDAPPEVPRLGDPEKPAQIFGRESCPWTGRAVALMEAQAASFEFIDLDGPGNGTLRDWLIAETKQNTEPYVFLRGRFVGGYNALDEIVRLGQLSLLMMTPGERARQPSRIQVDIVPRDDNGRPPPGAA